MATTEPAVVGTHPPTTGPEGTPAPTHQPGSAGGPGAQRVRRTTSELLPVDYATMIGCALSALALSWVVFTRLTDGVGWLGFVVVAYLLFLLLFGVVTADRINGLVARDRLATVAVTTGAIVLLAPLLWLVGYVVLKGFPALRLEFLLEDQRGITPTMPATEGGGSHAIIGSLQQVVLALLISAPLAVATAVFLNETRSRLRRPVRIFVDAMSGVPSVVAGLFIYALLILPYGGSVDLFGFNGFMASLALSMIMLPTITRTIEVVLRLVPDGLREASLAMGASRARTVWSVVLPTARGGVTTAVVLGIARAVGETAPLLFTAFGYKLFNSSPFANPQESLPLFVYRNIQQPDQSSIQRGFTGALVLMLLVLTLFAVARWFGRDRSKRMGRRQAPPVISAASFLDALPPAGAPIIAGQEGSSR
jgi:phosphate transport system permease protein